MLLNTINYKHWTWLSCTHYSRHNNTRIFFLFKRAQTFFVWFWTSRMKSMHELFCMCVAFTLLSIFAKKYMYVKVIDYKFSIQVVQVVGISCRIRFNFFPNIMPFLALENSHIAFKISKKVLLHRSE